MKKKVTMIIPSYWRREERLGIKDTDAIYDHPTPLDQDGTLKRAVDSIRILNNKDLISSIEPNSFSQVSFNFYYHFGVL